MNRRTVIVLAVVVLAAVVAAYALSARSATEAPRELPEAAWSGEESTTAGAEATGTTTATALVTTRELAESKRNDGDSSTTDVEDGAQDDASPAEDGDDNGAKSAKADVAKSLTVEERKAAYYALIEAEDRAVKEAEAEIPNQGDREQIDAHLALRFSLLEKYEASVREQYELSDADVAAILEEGVNNGWPMPPY